MAMARTSIPNMVGVSPPTAEKVVPYGEGVAQVNIRIDMISVNDLEDRSRSS